MKKEKQPKTKTIEVPFIELKKNEKLSLYHFIDGETNLEHCRHHPALIVKQDDIILFVPLEHFALSLKEVNIKKIGKVEADRTYDDLIDFCKETFNVRWGFMISPDLKDYWKGKLKSQGEINTMGKKKPVKKPIKK